MLTNNSNKPTTVVTSGFIHGELSSYYHGAIETTLYKNAVKELENIICDPYAGLKTRLGTRLILSSSITPVFSSQGNDTIVFTSDKITVYSRNNPSDAVSFNYPPELVAHPILSNAHITLVHDDIFSSTYYISPENGASAKGGFLTVTVTPETETSPPTFTTTYKPLTFTGTSVFKPVKFLYLNSRLITTTEDRIYLSSITNNTAFGDTPSGTPDITSYGMIQLGSSVSKSNILDFELSQHAIFIATASEYYVLGMNTASTTFLGLFTIRSITHRALYDTNFTLMDIRGSLFGVSAEFIDYIKFDVLLEHFSSVTISKYSSHIFLEGVRQATVDVGNDEAAIYILTLQGRLYHCLLTANDQPQNVTTSKITQYPFAKYSNENSQILKITSSASAILTYFDGMYYLESLPPALGLYTSQGTFSTNFFDYLPDNDFQIITRQYDYLDKMITSDYSKYRDIIVVNNTIVKYRYESSPDNSTQYAINDKIEIVYRNEKKALEYHTFIVFDIKVLDEYVVLTLYDEQHNVPNYLYRDINNEEHPKRAVITGTIKSHSVDVNYLTPFFSTGFVYAKYNLMGRSYVLQLKSPADLENVPDSVRLFVGVGYRSWVRFLPTQPMFPYDSYLISVACTFNYVLADVIFTYTNNVKESDFNIIELPDYINNYSDEEILSNLNTLTNIKPTETYKRSIGTIKLDIHSHTTNNLSSDFYIFTPIGFGFQLMNTFFEYK